MSISSRIFCHWLLNDFLTITKVVDMKKLVIVLLALAVIGFPLLTSCSPGKPSSDDIKCSVGKEVCISIDKVQPFTMGEPFLLNISVSSTSDITNLHFSLITHSGVTVDGPQSWEKYLSNSLNQPGMAVWDFSINSNQTLTFKRILRFPSTEGYYTIQTEVINQDHSIDVADSLTILLEKKGVQVIRPGTPLPPHTPENNNPSYGPGTPYPTNVPNIQTVNATLATLTAPTAKQLTPSPMVPLIVTPTPNRTPTLPNPYPPPGTAYP
jgi:hypothetical protein